MYLEDVYGRCMILYRLSGMTAGTGVSCYPRHFIFIEGHCLSMQCSLISVLRVSRSVSDVPIQRDISHTGRPVFFILLAPLFLGGWIIFSIKPEILDPMLAISPTH